MPTPVKVAGGAFLDKMRFSSFLLVVLISAMQEYPDRMLATFSILPSPKVSETVVEVSQPTPKEDLSDDIRAPFIDSHTMHCSPFTSS
jgi:hypothetical protein